MSARVLIVNSFFLPLGPSYAQRSQMLKATFSNSLNLSSITSQRQTIAGN